jgi:hypothetical protein
MRTAVIIAGGLLLLGAFIIAGRWFGGASPKSTTRAAMAFIPVWLGAALVNMWMGVARAGYSIGEELPIFLLIFAIPAGTALYAWRKASSHSRSRDKA